MSLKVFPSANKSQSVLVKQSYNTELACLGPYFLVMGFAVGWDQSKGNVVMYSWCAHGVALKQTGWIKLTS